MRTRGVGLSDGTRGNHHMSNENNYWVKRTQGGRITRRGLLGSAAIAGVGAASLGLVGCGDDNANSGPAKSIEQKKVEVQSILSQRVDTTAQAVKGSTIQSYTTF